MSDDIIKYISQEKDIAKYRLSLLLKGSKKSYKARLIASEKDFIEYPFERLLLSSISELKDAMNLFRVDRSIFYSKYENTSEIKKRSVTQVEIDRLIEKANYFLEKSISILNNDIKTVNVIQNEYVRSISKIKENDIENHGIDHILKAEGAYVSKARARVQILMYCLARFMNRKAKSLLAKINYNINPEEYDQLRLELNSFLSNLDSQIFKHYNDAIDEVPLLINGTLGHNNFISTIYPLSNALDRYNEDLQLERLLPEDKDFFSASGSFIDKKFVRRGFGVLTGINRIGNESMELLYLDLWSKSGIRLTPIFSTSFFNYKKNDAYYKAVSTRPILEWRHYADNAYLERVLSEFLGILDINHGSLDITNKKCFEVINNFKKGNIALDMSLSKLLIASTRSESGHIGEAKNYVFSFSKLILDEFNFKFAST